MKTSKLKESKVFSAVLKYFLITLGALIYAIGFDFLMYPNDIVSGGVTGIAMIINKLWGLPIGVLSIVLNIPLFVIAGKKFGMRFIFDSLVGLVMSSVFVDLLAIPGIVLTDQPLIACIIGGVIKGFGFGIIYWEGATTGGSDILAKLLRRRFTYINFGTMMLIMDTVIIMTFAVVFSNFDAAMYGIIALFVVSKVIDLVLYGIDTSNVCYIVSEKSDELTKEITDTLHRGVTILHGEGAYSKREKQVLMCVVKRAQSVEIRKIIKNVDEAAFLIVTDAKSVYGHGFGDISDMN